MKVTDIKLENPLSGEKVGLFDFSKMLGLLGGGVLLIVIWKWASNLSNAVFYRIPQAARNYGSPTPVDPNDGIINL